MKTFTKILGLVVVGAIISQSAMAVYLYKTAKYVDQEYWADDPFMIPVYGDSVEPLTGVLDVSSDNSPSDNTPLDNFDNMGYDPLTETITEVEVLFVVGGQLIDLKFGEFDQPNGVSDYSAIGGLMAGSFVYDFYFAGPSITGSLLMNLVETGKLNWSLYVEAGDGAEPAPLQAASLAVNTQSVPDAGASADLLGIALVTLVGLRRKFINR